MKTACIHHESLTRTSLWRYMNTLASQLLTTSSSNMKQHFGYNSKVSSNHSHTRMNSQHSWLPELN